jgi:hypothetical protein
VEVKIVVQHDVEATCTNFLDEMDMWSLVEKNPNKHITKVRL